MRGVASNTLLALIIETCTKELVVNQTGLFLKLSQEAEKAEAELEVLENPQLPWGS